MTKTPHDGDGDGFYTPFPGAPDKTPMPKHTWRDDMSDIEAAVGGMFHWSNSVAVRAGRLAELRAMLRNDPTNIDIRLAIIALLQEAKTMKKGRPNPKSTPKEIVGSHGHRSHGPSILWPAMYEHLRRKGMSKAKAAAISNHAWNRKHGMQVRNLASTRVTKDDVLAQAWDIVLSGEGEAAHPGGR